MNNLILESNTVQPSGLQSQTDCEQTEGSKRISRVRAAIDRLMNSLDTSCAQKVHDILTAAADDACDIVATWAAFGRRDRLRTPALDVSETARNTMTARGIACLVAYARAWCDEEEGLMARAAALTSSSPCREGEQSRRRRQDPPSQRPAPATAQRSRSKSSRSQRRAK